MASRLVARESETQSAILDVARLRGWRVAHFRAAQTAKGWRTPVAADGAGFPDLVLVRERVVFAELKRQDGRPRADQVEWLDALANAGAETYLWTLSDLDEVALLLADRWAYDSARHRLHGTPAMWWQPVSLWKPSEGRGQR